MPKLRITLAAAGLAAALAVSAGATSYTWNPATESLTVALQSLWQTPGDHTLYLPAGTFSGTQLSTEWSNNIIFEDYRPETGPRQADSIVIQGAGRDTTTGTLLLGTAGSEGDGMLRVNAADLTGVTFKDLALSVPVGGALFGQWQGGGKPAYVTMHTVDIYLVTAALIGRTNFAGSAPNQDDGQMDFIDSNIYMGTNRLLAQWDYNAGHPLEDMLQFDSGSAIYDWNTAVYGAMNMFSPIYDTSRYVVSTADKYVSFGAANDPGGDGIEYNSTIGFVGELTADPVFIPEPSSLAVFFLMLCLTGLRRGNVGRRVFGSVFVSVAGHRHDAGHAGVSQQRKEVGYAAI